jgi:predicted ATP-dependent protease
MDKVITDKATEEILKKVNEMRRDLDLIEENSGDFKYIQMISDWLKEENDSIKQFANTILKWD